MSKLQWMMRPSFLALLCLLLLLSLPALSFAQSTTQACTTLANDAFTELGASCANQEENTACYGFNSVDIEYFDPLSVDFPWDAGVRTDLTNVQEIAPQNPNIQTQTRGWGLSILSGLANIPRALDSTLIMAGLGSIEVYNLVLPEAAFAPLENGIAITTTTTAEYREATMTPPGRAEVRRLGTMPAGQQLVADVVSQDGSWARVVYNNRPVWVALSALDPDVSLADLPRFGPETFTPMQNICLGNPLGTGTCGSTTPALLIVQSPGDYPVDLRVQSADLRVQGSVALRMVGNSLELNVLNGVAVLHPDTRDQIIVPAAFRVVAPVGAADEIGCAPLTGPWSDPRQLTGAELSALGAVENIPNNLLNDPIILPDIYTPSGVGQVRTIIVLNDSVSRRLVPLECRSEVIPTALCQAYGL